MFRLAQAHTHTATWTQTRLCKRRQGFANYCAWWNTPKSAEQGIGTSRRLVGCPSDRVDFCVLSFCWGGFLRFVLLLGRIFQVYTGRTEQSGDVLIEFPWIAVKASSDDCCMALGKPSADGAVWANISRMHHVFSHWLIQINPKPKHNYVKNN